MAWTEERIALLTKLWSDGLTASQIASQLGDNTTRNAVIGKAHRLGLSGRPSPVRTPRDPGVKPVRQARPKPLVGHQRLPVMGKPKPNLIRKAEPAARPQSLEVVPGPGVTLLKVTDKMCKWPIGHPGDDGFRFCGNESRDGSPYCEGHAQMAYQPLPPKRERRAG